MKKLIAISGIILAMGSFLNTVNAMDRIPGTSAKPASYFYTGKPYDKDLGAYVFSARNYNPETNRWASADPSGFPDGANNHIYTSAPTWKFDPTGFLETEIVTTSPVLTWATDWGTQGGKSATLSFQITFDQNTQPTGSTVTATGAPTASMTSGFISLSSTVSAPFSVVLSNINGTTNGDPDAYYSYSFDYTINWQLTASGSKGVGLSISGNGAGTSVGWASGGTLSQVETTTGHYETDSYPVE
jgi:RHS repeat-associated protein